MILYFDIPSLALYLAILAICTLITINDIKTMEIPNCLSLALVACGILACFITPQITLMSRFIGALCISLPMLILCFFATDAFGGGDIKLMAAAGFLLGTSNVLIAGAIGLIAGAIWGIYLLVFKQKQGQAHFAFGPALCLGIALSVPFGKNILAMLV